MLLDDAEMKGQEVEEQFLSTRPPDLQGAGGGAPNALPTIPGNSIQPDSTAALQPAKIPPSEARERFRCKYGQNLHFVLHCSLYCAVLRLWRRSDRLRGKLQFSKPPRLLPTQLAVRVGDQGAAPLPGSDPSVVPGRGGTLPLSV